MNVRNVEKHFVTGIKDRSKTMSLTSLSLTTTIVNLKSK